MYLKIFLSGFLFILSFWAEAYIPSVDMVFSRLKKQQGSGWYKISQKVTFLETSQFTESFEFKETLWKGPQSSFIEMRSLDFPNVKFTFSFKKSSKEWKDPQIRQNFNTNQSMEFYFSQKIPSWMSSVSVLELGRALGVVNYVFKNKNKTVWVEQDEFVIRQIQITDSEKEKFILKAQNYQMFSRGFFFPRIREFISQDYKIRIEVEEVEPLSKGVTKKLIENKWEFSNLNQDMNLVRTFYQKYR